MKVTLQLPAVRVQLPDMLKVPVTLPVEEKATVPEGVSAVPALEVSVTVAVQEEAVFTVTGVLHMMDVEVVRRATEILKAVEVLPL